MEENKPELRKLVLELKVLSWADVKDTALELGIKLKDVEGEHATKIEQLCATMQQWLDNDAEVSWKRIVEALRAVEKNNLAKNLEQKYCKSIQLPQQEAIKPIDEQCYPLPRDYLFVEAPPNDLLCPVTYKPLLEPHLTTCCGHHLSFEAATRIQTVGGACPFCKEIEWSTVLNKYFKRQIYSLHVYCYYEDRGCLWEGELADYEKHVKHCSREDDTFHKKFVDDTNIIFRVSGVPILEKQYILYTGKQMDYIWEEAGISLYFPPASCEKAIKVSVGIFTDVENDCVLPWRYQKMRAASAIYKITASDTFTTPVRVKMEYCAIKDKEGSLVHMRACGGPPYHFKALNHEILGDGEIELTEFCLLTILYNIFDMKLSLAIHVVYLKENIVHFLVTKNLAAHNTAAKENYTGAIMCKSYTMQCFFKTTEIYLSIPALPSGCDGWHIIPSWQPATITMRDIHAYQPGSVIPKIELKLKWQGEGNPQEKDIQIQIHGGSKDSFTLFCKPEAQQVEHLTSSASPISQLPPGLSLQTQLLVMTERPTLPQLYHLSTEFGDEIRIIERVTVINHALGIVLLNDESGAKTSNIEAHCKHDPLTRVTESILRTWMEGNGRRPPSWGTLITVLKELRQDTLAKEITLLLPHTKFMNKSLSRSREAQLTRVEQTIGRDQEEPEKLRQQEGEIVQAKDKAHAPVEQKAWEEHDQATRIMLRDKARKEFEKKQAELLKVQREVIRAQEELNTREEQLKPPSLVSEPDKILPVLGRPYGVAFNSCMSMLVSGWGENCIFMFNEKHEVVLVINEFKNMKAPADIVLDKDDNIYVTGKHGLQKFNKFGEHLHSIGKKGKEEGEFDDPRGITRLNDRLYISDRNNHRIQVFKLDLTFYKSIGSYGEEPGELNAPFDVKFDSTGNMYVVELGNRRVQVFDGEGTSISIFGQERIGNVGLPTGLHVENDRVYVSDFANDRIVVLNKNGDYVGVIGSHGQEVSELHSPYCMTSRGDKLYVCDSGNSRIQIFDLFN